MAPLNFFGKEQKVERSKKSDVIAKIKADALKSEAVFAVNQNKMTVAETEALRRQLREVTSSYFVTKNTLARLGFKDTPYECLVDKLHGQTALVFAGDITAAAKVISDFSSANEAKMAIVCGGYQGNLLSIEQVKMLASMPSMDELRAKIIAVIQTPAQRLAVCTKEPAAQLARLLSAFSEK